MNETRLSIWFENALQVVQVPTTPEPQIRGIFTLQVGPYIFKGENMASTLPSGTPATASIEWVDANNNPATVDGQTTWASSNGTILTVTVDPTDSSKASVVSAGPIGPAQIQATADADMGAGIQTITAVLDVTVIAGQAVGGVITLS